MSNVRTVPVREDLDGENALETLREAEAWSIAKRAGSRFRQGDGFSFARSIAFQGILTLIPGTIFVVGLAAALGEGQIRRAVSTMVDSLAPGPAGEIFRQALAQGSETGSSGNWIAVLVGGIAMLIAAVTATAQLQRGSTRIYGVDQDRPTLLRYATAAALTLTAGVLVAMAFGLTALGGSLGGYFEDPASAVWAWARWPLGILALVIALAGLYSVAPNRRQPTIRWLAVGGFVAAVLWVVSSAALALYLNNSGTFGETYGPLGGFIALALWTQVSAIAVLYGVAVNAELEAERAGIHDPVVRESEDLAKEGAPHGR